MGRTPCCDKNGQKKGPWTPEEDHKLVEYINTHGPGNWRTLPKNAGLQRCGKSCRLRWTNYLRPDIKRGRFSFEEEETIIQLHSILGNKWSAIAARLPGRTDNEIKNYWNTHIRKRLLRSGIDPVTHSPRLDLLDLSSLLNSAQLNLTNLLGLQTLVNPEALRLLAILIASSNENPEQLLQKVQENQFLNAQMQTQNPILQQNQLQNPIPQISTCTAGNVSSSSYLNNQTLPTQMSLEEFLMNSSTENLGQNLPSLSEGFATQPNYSDHIRSGSDVSENSNFQSLNNNSSKHHFSFDSVLSTPLSSPAPLNSSSTFVNSNNAEEEMESYCSNMMKFEFPESLDFDSFM